MAKQSKELYGKLPKSVRNWLEVKVEAPRGYTPGYWLVIVIGGILGTAVFSGLLLSSLTYFGVFGEVPGYESLKGIKNRTASEVYAADGVLMGKYYIENRQNAEMEEITPLLVNALVATEDARFFEHSGIDFRVSTISKPNYAFFQHAQYTN